MFEAIRSKLVGAWKDLHARGLPSLFLFELIVVTLGVLLAQAVAEWAGERAEERRMKDAIERARVDLAEAMWVSEAYALVQPCFEERMTRIMRAASDGETLPSQILERPGLRATRMHRLEGVQFERMAQTMGYEAADNLRDATEQVETLRQRAVELTEAWEGLALLDPENGTPSAQDRATARQAGSRIKALFRGIEINAENIVRQGRNLGVEPDNKFPDRLPKDCAEIWQYSQMTPSTLEER